MMDFDPRDRDQDVRDVEMPWVEVGQASDMARDNDDWRDRDEDTRGGDQDARQRDVDDPRDVFVNGLDLPRGPDREIVTDGDHRYELNGDDSRSLATVGVLRVVTIA